ncbi:hypothetical protein LZ198_01100 [Myxococcus sp. K15C18031901]|uniref:hypothetical protein n=1 Tax=Myxococcus dinghuensis TaxID=2906761 RepID=UPI0020A736A3|nr:hypothetical protein [Myxococcus dinghuensis]MCP3097464.1 hypothetical protein [Myxococcus dinghuensis]
MLALLLVVPRAEAGTRPRRVANATDVVKVWSDSQHLYVKGDVGVSDTRLAELESWLTANAPHWTVVLLESSQGERFVDAEGKGFSDSEAVLHALGKGLSNRTRFGALTHAKTGETDGTVLVVSLRERKLSYFGSDAQDRRGLGEDEWAGNLDQSAVKAMRGGGRLVDAVMGTVQFVDERLDLILAEEAQKKREALAREEAERARRQAEAEVALAQAREAARTPLLQLQSRLRLLVERRWTTFGEALPAAVSPDVFDVEGLQQRLAEALVLAEQPTPENQVRLRATDEAVRQKLEAAEQVLASAEAAASRLKALESSLEKASSHADAALASAELEAARAAMVTARRAARDLSPSREQDFAVAAQALAKVETALGEAQRARARVQSLSDQLDVAARSPHAGKARGDLAKARAALDETRAALERNDAAYATRLSQAEVLCASAVSAVEAARQAFVAMVAGLVLGGAGVVLAGYLVRRRRNQRRRAALALHARRRSAVDGGTQALFVLQERTHVAAGASHEATERRFVGVSRERAARLVSGVDELFLLSAAASRVLHRAEAVLTPKDAWDWLGSQVSTARYDALLALLRDAPIVFHSDDGVEAVVRGPRKDDSGGTGAIAPFSLTFGALWDAFDSRSGRAREDLEALEESPERASSQVDALERGVIGLRGLEAGPEVLRTREIVSGVRGALEALLVEARSLLAADPLGALEGPLARGLRLDADSRRLLSVLEQAEEDVVPEVERTGAALVGAGLPRRWLDEALAHLTSRAVEEGRALASPPHAPRLDAASVVTASQSPDALGLMGMALVVADLGGGGGSAHGAVGGLSLVTGLTNLSRTPAGPVEGLDASFRALLEKMLDARELVDGVMAARREVDRTARAQEAAREEVGHVVGRPAREVLREKGHDPSELQAQAESSLGEACAALGEGHVEVARTALAACADRVKQQDALLARSLGVVRTFTSRREVCLAQSTRLEVLVAEGSGLVESLTRRHAVSTLTLLPGERLRPEDGDTAPEYAASMARLWTGTRAQLTSAERAFSEVRLVESEGLLAQVEAGQRQVQALFDVLAGLARRLESAEAEHTRGLHSAEELARRCDAEVADTRTTRATLGAFASARQRLDSLREASARRPLDLDEMVRQRGALMEALDRVRQDAKSDRLLHEQATQGLAAVKGAYAAADRWVATSASDGVTDSRATEAAIRAIRELGQQMEKAFETLGRTHEDWLALDQEAGRLLAELAARTADLRGEVESAASAAREVESAASAVQRAACGGRRAGSGMLIVARGHLERGEYEEARRAASESTRQAKAAIEAAQREDERRRKLEEEAYVRRMEAARRRTGQGSHHAGSGGALLFGGRDDSSSGRGTGLGSLFSSSSSSSSSSRDSGGSGSGFSGSSFGGGDSSDDKGSSGSGSGFGSSSW